MGDQSSLPGEGFGEAGLAADNRQDPAAVGQAGRPTKEQGSFNTSLVSELRFSSLLSHTSRALPKPQLWLRPERVSAGGETVALSSLTLQNSISLM